MAILLPALSGCFSLTDGEPWPAPAFTVTDTDGIVHNLTDYRGRVLVVDIMATWCKPCQAEMPHLATIRDAYPEDQVALLSIDGDPSETRDQLAGFKRRFNAPWAFALDTDNVRGKLELTILPKLVIIDPEGNVVFENQGETYPVAMARVINRYVEGA